MASPILARADALMQRRRPTSPEPDDVPLLTDAISPEDDIPLLVDVETPAPVAEATPAFEAEIETEATDEPLAAAAAHPEPTAEDTPSLAFEGEMLDIIAHELARRVNDRLAAELPGIIESTIREFLAEPEILTLTKPRD
ncbi:MAG: hypothetical protein JNN31_01050 [Dechloromonas sp.]|nr:hypothetical protein [Dechloromonas sp.]